MATEHIAVTGIRPREDSIDPLGHHLRWSFPEQLGFPAKGFVIYRRLSNSLKPSQCLDLTKNAVPTGQLLANGSNLEGVSFHYPSTVQIQGSSNELTVNLPSPKLLELRFTDPMAFVSIEAGGVQGPLQLRAYAGLQLVATSLTLTSNSGVLEVTSPHITRVTIPLNFQTLDAICYVSMKAACGDRSWGQPIANLPLINSVDQGVARLEAGLQNRYARDRDQATQRYKPELEALIKWLTLLQNRTDTAFINPGDSPDQLRLPALDANSPLQSIRPQAMLLLAALDPNIARFLSLYWVDKYGGSDSPEVGISYDYKVEGQWRGARVGCGLVFGLGAKESALPFIDRPPSVDKLLKGDQLPGLRWRDKTPLGRVGLRWPRPKEGQGAVQPILFDLWRDPGSGRETFLTKNQPVLVPAQSWANDGTALFIDTAVSLGQHSYRLRGIDLFGQVGQSIESKEIAVKDLEAPPPPVRLRANLMQPGYPWRSPKQPNETTEAATLTLQFEYGDAQHRQAPDAKTFRVYWRPESMFVSRSVTVQRVSSQALEDNLKIHTVRLLGGDPLDLGTFLGGKLSRESGTDTPLPAIQRHHYQVAKLLSSDELQLAPDQLQLAPSEHSFVNGSYRLISDPRLRTNWKQLDFTIPVRQPLQGLLQSTAPFQARAAKVETLTPRQDQLALMPVSHRPTQLDEPPPIVEVELDRRLLETDLFAGGTLQVEGQTHPILYSTSGAESPARLGLPPGTNISIGATLTLSPARPFQPFSATIQQIELLPSNRLAVTLPAQSSPAGTTHLLGGIVTIEGQKHNILQAQEDSAGLRLELRAVGALPNNLNSWLDRTAQITPPLLQALTIQGAVPDEVAKVLGGEIAFDITQNGQLVTYVGRIVSNIGTVANGFNLLVSLSPAAQAALQPNTTRCRYYAPYRQELNVRLPITRENTDSATTIDLPMAVGQSSQNLYLAVTTDDVRANEGPLSSPAQVMAVKPPPTGAPSRPYPCGQDAAAESGGYATPPDRQGRATLCLAWDAGELGSTEGLRYEVARVLDNTILTTHRRNWLLGGPSLGTALSVSGMLSGEPFDETRGLYRVVLTANLGGAEPAAFRGGRLAQNGGFFQITTIAAGDAGTVQLMLRPMAKNVPTNGNAANAGLPVPTNGAAEIERLPDYDAAVRDGIVDLRQLAKDNPDAFSLVTGVPIPNATDPDTGVPLRETSFRDEIPGIGRNRFFYRVRAVDTAENRSDWSEVSVPFYQVDTTPPDAPREFQVFPGDRSATLMWLPSQDPQVTGYRVYRAEESESDFNALSSNVFAELKLNDLQPRRLIAISGSLTLPQPLEFTVASGLNSNEIATQIVAQIVVQELARGMDAPNLLDSVASHLIFNTKNKDDGTTSVTVTALTGLLSVDSNAPLKVIVGQRVIDGDPSVQTWTDEGLSGGARYGYRVAAERNLRAAPEASSQLFREIAVVGPPTGSAKITVIDLSVPAAPIITGAEWVNANGVGLTRASSFARVRLIAQMPVETARFLVQRRAGDASPWSNPPVNGTRGWQEWFLSDAETELIDPTADPARDWTYRVLISTADSRQSEPSDMVLVAKLAP